MQIGDTCYLIENVSNLKDKKDVWGLRGDSCVLISVSHPAVLVQKKNNIFPTRIDNISPNWWTGKSDAEMPRFIKHMGVGTVQKVTKWYVEEGVDPMFEAEVNTCIMHISPYEKSTVEEYTEYIKNKKRP